LVSLPYSGGAGFEFGVGIPTVLNEVFGVFPVLLQATVRAVTRLNSYCSLPDPFNFIIHHHRCCHSTLLNTDSAVKEPAKRTRRENLQRKLPENVFTGMCTVSAGNEI
jgi:hypothetical protein